MKIAARPPPLRPRMFRKSVVTEGPVFERHHVDGGNVVAAEKPVGGRNLGVLECAVADRAFHRANIRILSGRAFDRAHADIPEPAVVNVDVFRGILGFDFDPVGAAVRERKVGDGNAFAAGNVEKVIAHGLTVPSLAAEDHPGRISRSAAQGDILLLPEDKNTGKPVVTIGQQDRSTGRDAIHGGEQLLRGVDVDHLPLRWRQYGSFGKPRRYP